MMNQRGPIPAQRTAPGNGNMAMDRGKNIGGVLEAALARVRTGPPATPPGIAAGMPAAPGLAGALPPGLAGHIAPGAPTAPIAPGAPAPGARMFPMGMTVNGRRSY